MNDEAHRTGAPLIDRGKSMLDQLLHLAQTRLEMLSVEIQREKLAIASQLKLAMAAAVCAWLAGLTLVLWVALALPPPLRTWLLGTLFGVLLLMTLACAIALKRRANREPLFSRLARELRMDRASLGQEP